MSSWNFSSRQFKLSPPSLCNELQFLFFFLIIIVFYNNVICLMLTFEWTVVSQHFGLIEVLNQADRIRAVFGQQVTSLSQGHIKQ